MLKIAVDTFVYGVLRLPADSHLAAGVHFFVYDSVKIFALLFVMISVIGFVRSFVSIQAVKVWLHKSGAFGNLVASSFGAVTPFCSCSSIPLFLSFLEAGIPLGVTFSFLITSPIINEYLAVLMFGYFGWKITLAYVVSGIGLGVCSGLILGKLGLEKYLEQDMLALTRDSGNKEVTYTRFGQRVLFGVGEALSIIKKLWIWIFVGIGIGALIHNFVPQASVDMIVAKTGFIAVPLVVIVGVPMYGSCAAIVPIAIALFEKGFPLGTALAFMMAVSALSLPEAIVLRRAMKLKLIGIFFGITAAGIIFTGYLFNFLQKFLL